MKYICHIFPVKGEHWWITIFKEGEEGQKKISLAPTLFENLIIIRSLSPLKFKKIIFVLLAPTLSCRWISVQIYFALQLGLRSYLLTPSGSQIRPTYPFWTLKFLCIRIETYCSSNNYIFVQSMCKCQTFKDKRQVQSETHMQGKVGLN